MVKFTLKNMIAPRNSVIRYKEPNKYAGGILLIGIILLLAGCMPPQDLPPSLPLEIQAVQTRTYEAPKREVFDATVTTLQNIGIQIQNVDYGSGTIMGYATATLRDYSFRSTAVVILISEQGENRSSINTNLTEEVALIDRTEEDSSKVTLYRQQQVSPELYQNLLNRIEQTLFQIQTTR